MAFIEDIGVQHLHPRKAERVGGSWAQMTAIQRVMARAFRTVSQLRHRGLEVRAGWRMRNRRMLKIEESLSKRWIFPFIRILALEPSPYVVSKLLLWQ